MAGLLPEDILAEFLGEYQEMLERLSLNLAFLEREGHSKDRVRDIYRDIHTIKGNAMMFGLELTGRLNHSAENVLDPIREKDLSLSKHLGDLLFKVLDLNQTIAKEMAANGAEPDITTQVDAVINELETELGKLQTGEPATQEKVNQVSQEMTEEIKEQRQEVIKPKESPVAKASRKKNNPAPKSQPTEDSAQETIRVNIGILDNFMNLIGELVLVRNRLSERAKSLGDEDVSISQQLSGITRDLQNEVMKTRMQPVGNVVNKFHRVIRDLARDLHKDILVNISGAETELDRSLLDAIKDPLMHIVRNCADHGIELPSKREEAGKPKQGNIFISAFHEGGQVKIEIKDNGQGINPEKIKKKAVEKGIITEGQAVGLSEAGVFDLIFMPGFSTAESISNVSGRGVGMDVVKTNIEKIGGSVRLNSVFGEGTTTTLEIPLTLAIMQALIVSIGGQRFAIPQSSLSQLIQLYPDHNNAVKIEFLEGKPVFRLRGELIPLVILENTLELTDTTAKEILAQRVKDGQIINIVIIKVAGKNFGALVDEIEDSIDIVVKPLGPFLQSIAALSGATILGNGDIALTLDISALAQLSGVANRDAHASVEDKNMMVNTSLDEMDYLLVNASESENIVIPLSHVHRLEEFPSKGLQHTGELLVYPYRKTLLPIFDLGRILGRQSSEISEEEFVSVVVIKQGENIYGLRVGEFSDIISAHVELNSQLRDRRGIMGGFAHNNRVYLVVDYSEIINIALENLHLSNETVDQSDLNLLKEKRRKHHILLAEDSNFFRKQIAEYLKRAGFLVTALENGIKAWNEFNRSNIYDLIISDIEMPEMDGYELATKVRAMSNRKHIPMIAVTSKFGNSDVKKGMECGFNRYLQKLNKEELIDELDMILKISA